MTEFPKEEMMEVISCTYVGVHDYPTNWTSELIWEFFKRHRITGSREVGVSRSKTKSSHWTFKSKTIATIAVIGCVVIAAGLYLWMINSPPPKDAMVNSDGMRTGSTGSGDWQRMRMNTRED